MTKPNDRARGITLPELVVTLAVFSLIAAIAAPVYSQHVSNARMQIAIADMKSLEGRIDRYYVFAKKYPDNLTEVIADVPVDPWGNVYQYTPIEGAGTGQFRKDKNLVPINTDFDLYSMGQDGASMGPLTAKPSRDDIVRASNGRYFGLAESY